MVVLYFMERWYGAGFSSKFQIVKYLKADKCRRNIYLLSVAQVSFTRKANMVNVPKVKFNNGLEIPIFGLGTWKVTTSFLFYSNKT